MKSIGIWFDRTLEKELAARNLRAFIHAILYFSILLTMHVNEIEAITSALVSLASCGGIANENGVGQLFSTIECNRMAKICIE